MNKGNHFWGFGLMLWLISCATAEEAGIAGVADRVKMGTVTTVADSQSENLTTTQPQWIVSSEDSKASAGDKSGIPIGKPSGPFSVQYTLEGWAEDDHRLIITLKSNRLVDEWAVSLPQLEKSANSRISESAKTQNAELNVQRKMFELGELPSLDRLLVTVSVVVLGQTASKTIAIPLRQAEERRIRTCEAAAKDCFYVFREKTT